MRPAFAVLHSGVVCCFAPQCLHFGSDTFANSSSPLAARLSCGGLLEVTSAVVHGKATSGVAVIRPPGHHAEPDRVMGFCLYNNVGVAAQVARTQWGVNRVLIVDWDVHHGNGTQEMFYSDPSVLYFSTHRYDSGRFYPGTGSAREVGTGAGAGYNINVPWPCGNMGDAEYFAAFSQVLMPVALAFDPDLVIVSAGFDAADGDPLGGCSLTPKGEVVCACTHCLLRQCILHDRCHNLLQVTLI